MGTSNSSTATRERSAALASQVRMGIVSERRCHPSQIGAYHMDINIDTVIAAITGVFSLFTKKVPKFKVRAAVQLIGFLSFSKVLMQWSSSILAGLWRDQRRESRAAEYPSPHAHGVLVLVCAAAAVGSRPPGIASCSWIGQCGRDVCSNGMFHQCSWFEGCEAT